MWYSQPISISTSSLFTRWWNDTFHYTLKCQKQILAIILSEIRDRKVNRAGTGTWSLYYLSKYPNILQELREENIIIREKKGQDQILIHNNEKMMCYTSKVAEEVIKVANIVPVEVLCHHDEKMQRGELKRMQHQKPTAIVAKLYIEARGIHIVATTTSTTTGEYIHKYIYVIQETNSSKALVQSSHLCMGCYDSLCFCTRLLQFHRIAYSVKWPLVVSPRCYGGRSDSWEPIASIRFVASVCVIDLLRVTASLHMVVVFPSHSKEKACKLQCQEKLEVCEMHTNGFSLRISDTMWYSQPISISTSSLFTRWWNDTFHYTLKCQKQLLAIILSEIRDRKVNRAGTGTWSLYYLSKYPNILQELREENIIIREKKGQDQILIHNNEKMMGYTSKVAEEVIKLANIVPVEVLCHHDEKMQRGELKRMQRQKPTAIVTKLYIEARGIHIVATTTSTTTGEYIHKYIYVIQETNSNKALVQSSHLCMGCYDSLCFCTRLLQFHRIAYSYYFEDEAFEKGGYVSHRMLPVVSCWTESPRLFKFLNNATN
eukprot:Gb_07832 [translate_table: standard]